MLPCLPHLLVCIGGGLGHACTVVHVEVRGQPAGALAPFLLLDPGLGNKYQYLHLLNCLTGPNLFFFVVEIFVYIFRIEVGKVDYDI